MLPPPSLRKGNGRNQLACFLLLPPRRGLMALHICELFSEYMPLAMLETYCFWSFLIIECTAACVLNICCSDVARLRKIFLPSKSCVFASCLEFQVTLAFCAMCRCAPEDTSTMASHHAMKITDRTRLCLLSMALYASFKDLKRERETAIASSETYSRSLRRSPPLKLS